MCCSQDSWLDSLLLHSGCCYCQKHQLPLILSCQVVLRLNHCCYPWAAELLPFLLNDSFCTGDDFAEAGCQFLPARVSCRTRWLCQLRLPVPLSKFLPKRRLRRSNGHCYCCFSCFAWLHLLRGLMLSVWVPSQLPSLGRWRER